MKPASDVLECQPREILVQDFPILSREIDGNRIIYLDNAAKSLTPRQVVSAISHYYLDVCGSVHRGQHYLAEEASQIYEGGRKEVAQFIGSSADEVIFVKNATEAFNLVARTLDLTKNDKVIIGGDSHHSNLLPWMHAATALVVRTDTNGAWDLQQYADFLKSRPKVVALTHRSNVTGVYAPLKEMAAMAKESGSIVVADVSQSVPHRRINVKEIDIDFLGFSGHKMLGPTGVGVLYARRDVLADLKPDNLGGGMVDWVRSDGWMPRRGPQKYESGTPNIGGVFGLQEAIRYLETIGFDSLKSHDLALGQVMLAEAKKREHYLEAISMNASSDRGAIISIRFRRYDKLDEVAKILSDSYGIMVRSGHMCAQPFVDSFSRTGVLRSSGYLYNTKKDVEDFFQALDEIRTYLK